MTSPARIAANQRNAQTSTGPKSAEGKAKAALNALKHGLSAETVVLPGENAEAFEQRLAMWREAYGAADPARAAMIDRAVISTWRLDRCARAEKARATARERHAADEFELAQRRRAEELGAKLLYEPTDRGEPWKNKDEVSTQRFARRENEPAAFFLREMLSFAQGVDWLLARWAELREPLASFGTWENNQIYEAARMLGRRPEMSTDDPLVSRLLLCAHAAGTGGYAFRDYFSQARRCAPNNPIEEDRYRVRRDTLTPESAEAARAWMLATVDQEMDRLRALKADRLDELAALDAECAAAAACIDGSEGGVLVRRYESACERELHRALAELRRGVIPGIQEEEQEKEIEQGGKKDVARTVQGGTAPGARSESRGGRPLGSFPGGDGCAAEREAEAAAFVIPPFTADLSPPVALGRPDVRGNSAGPDGPGVTRRGGSTA